MWHDRNRLMSGLNFLFFHAREQVHILFISYISSRELIDSKVKLSTPTLVKANILYYVHLPNQS